MIEVAVTAFDANGRSLAFAMGCATTFAAAKYAATIGMKARMAADRKLSGLVRSYSVERI